jgi:hypothetical protein
MDDEGSAFRLHVVMIGGQYAGQRIECHDIEFHIAADESGLVSACRNQSRPAFKARHIDGWIALPLQAPEAENATTTDRLYLAELGQNRADSFYELHDYALIVASDGRSALREAKSGHSGWHVDNLIDLSREAELLGHRLDARSARNGARLVSKYIRL